MSKTTPSSVTAEEAVARMVNMDYIPEGFTLEDMLSAFREEADVELYNAKIDRLPDTQVESLKVRMDACDARLSLAQLLLRDLRHAVGSTQEPAIVLSPDSSSKPRYTLDSVSDWATIKYGIDIPEWPSDSVDPASSGHAPNGATWEDIEIRIRKDNIIAYSHKKGKWTKKTFDKIGLLNKTTQQPNNHANILINLSVGKKYPPSGTLLGGYKTAMNSLRKSLKNLTGIQSEPFTRFNKTDGWKPRFKLTDDRRNADDRAKKAAIHAEYDDKRNYADENDKAGNWIKDNE